MSLPLGGYFSLISLNSKEPLICFFEQLFLEKKKEKKIFFSFANNVWGRKSNANGLWLLLPYFLREKNISKIEWDEKPEVSQFALTGCYIWKLSKVNTVVQSKKINF